jgi:hypothetical protein
MNIVKILDKIKQATRKMQCLQDPNQNNLDNLNNFRNFSGTQRRNTESLI